MMRRCVIGVGIAILIAGSVTFAQTQGRTEHYSIGPIADQGYPVGHCADGDFDVLTDYVFLMTGVVRYDKSGQPVADRYQFKLLGESVYYNSTDPEKSVPGGPGEVENKRLDPKTGYWAGSGLSFKIRIPGYGLIFAETGHFVYDASAGEFVFQSGHNQFADQDLAALCDYLK
jgi:hypothetical protein